MKYELDNNDTDRSYIPRTKFHLTNEQLTENFAGPKSEEFEEKLGLYTQPTEQEISGDINSYGTGSHLI